MKRKMIGAAAAYMAGLFFASFFTSPALIVGFAAVIAAAAAVGRRYGFKAFDFGVMSVFFAAAMIVFSVYTAVNHDRCMTMEDCKGSFRGEVTDAVRYSGERSNYILSGCINGDIPARVSFYTQGTYAEIGDIISIGECTFSRLSCDYLFDSERYYKSEGVFLALDSAKDISIEHTDAKKLSRAAASYRERIISDFRVKMGDDSGDLLAGMVFGEKRGMDQGVKTALYRCGIGHILAVSGLHVSVAVLVLMGLLRMCRVNKYVSFAVMEALIIFITALANYPVSAIRAAIMMNFFYAAGLFRRQNDSFNALAGAVLLICICQPYAIYDSGFILSVAGTFGIAVFAPYMTKDMPRDTLLQKAIANFAVMLCTTVCILPFSLMYFDETSLVSPLTNIIIVPFCSLSMVIGLIYALTAGIVDLLPFAKAVNDMVLRISDAAAHIRYTHFACDSRAVRGGLIICAICVAFAAAIFRNRRYICVSAAAAVAFLFAGSGISQMKRSEQTIVAVLGKGNNAAIVVSSNGTAEVIDLSGHYRSAAYVKKYLSRNGIGRVDNVVLMENVNAAFASYDKELSYTDVGNWLVACEDEVVGVDMEISTVGSSAEIRCGDMSISFDDGAVRVEDSGSSVCFADSIKAVKDSGSLAVICGNSPQDADVPDNTLFISGNNNFEIVLSDSGSFDIRRL